MRYEKFLFTRNKARDFNALIRPKEMSNADIQIIRKFLDGIEDISKLTEEWAGLYSFVLGEYRLLLRYYQSHRTHAGRKIPVLEGIAVKMEWIRHFSFVLPYLLLNYQDDLCVVDDLVDIEKQDIENSGGFDWSLDKADKLITGYDANVIVNDFWKRFNQDTLVIPFNEEGLQLLVSITINTNFPPISFAFGATPEAAKSLPNVDVVSFFSTSKSFFRSRA